MEEFDPILKLKKTHKILKLYDLVFLGLAITALVFCFIDGTLALGILCVSFLWKLIPIRILRQQYEKTFIHLRSQTMLERCLEHGRHTQETVLTEEEIRESRMLPCNSAKGSLLLREGGTGIYHGRTVTLGDVTLTHTFSEGTQKRHHFLVGSWVKISLKRDTGLNCRFLSEELIPSQSLKEMLWVESDLRQSGTPMLLKKSWTVLCPPKSQTMPDDAVLVQLDKLYEKTNGQTAVCIQGNSLHIFLSGEILARKVSYHYPPEFQIGDSPLPSLSLALELSDVLGFA